MRARPSHLPPTDTSRRAGGLPARATPAVFVAASMIGYVRPPSGTNIYLHTGELALLAFVFLALPALIERGQAGTLPASTVLAPVVLLAVPLVYQLVWPWLGGSPHGRPSITLGVAAAVYVTCTIVYGHLLFDDHLLLAWFVRLLAATLAVAFAAYVAEVAAGTGWLVHTEYGTPRLQGLLSEPSGWGPFLGAGILIGLERRRWVLVAASVAAALLTKSPTVIVCLGLTIPAYLLLAHRWRTRRTVIIVAVTTAAWWLWQQITTVTITDTVSTSIKDQVFARLASGIVNIRTNQAEGRNDRYTSTDAIIGAMTDHGWWWTGIGPGAARYWEETLGVLPNSLPVWTAGAFGAFGVVVLAAALVVAVARLRRSPLFALFLPFTVAGLVNSAGGWESYKYVILLVVVALLRKPQKLPTYR